MAKFMVTYRMSGEATSEVEAENHDAAKKIVETEFYSDDFDVEPDMVEYHDFSIRELHPIIRAGKKMWTTYPLPGDVRGHDEAAP